MRAASRRHRLLWGAVEVLAAASWCSPVGNPAAGLALTGGPVGPADAIVEFIGVLRAHDRVEDELLWPLPEHVLSERLTGHLDDEERELLPLVQRYLSIDEWARYGARGRAGIRAARLPVYAGWVLDGIDALDREHHLARLPRRARLRWHLGGRRRWRRERNRLYDSDPCRRATFRPLGVVGYATGTQR